MRDLTDEELKDYNESLDRLFKPILSPFEVSEEGVKDVSSRLEKQVCPILETSIQRVGSWDEAVVDDISLVMQYENPKKRALTDDELGIYKTDLDRLYKPVPSKYPISEEGLDTFLKNFEEHVYPAIEEAGGVEKLEAIAKRRRAEVEKAKKERQLIREEQEKRAKVEFNEPGHL